jgi:hypothetical protein
MSAMNIRGCLLFLFLVVVVGVVIGSIAGPPPH